MFNTELNFDDEYTSLKEAIASGANIGCYKTKQDKVFDWRLFGDSIEHKPHSDENGWKVIDNISEEMTVVIGDCVDYQLPDQFLPWVEI